MEDILGLTDSQLELISTLKFSTEPGFGEVAVFSSGTTIAKLIPISVRMVEDPGLVEKLFRWRAAAMGGFLTVFIPSPEKTSEYLKNIVLADPVRILFLITDVEGRPLGNIGLCNVSGDTAEVDNVVRGENVSIGGFMGKVQSCLIEWAHLNLGIKKFYLNVLSDNERALSSYTNAGYVETRRVGLVRETFDGGYRLVPTKCNPDGKQPSLVRMELYRQPT